MVLCRPLHIGCGVESRLRRLVAVLVRVVRTALGGVVRMALRRCYLVEVHAATSASAAEQVQHFDEQQSLLHRLLISILRINATGPATVWTSVPVYQCTTSRPVGDMWRRSDGEREGCLPVHCFAAR